MARCGNLRQRSLLVVPALVVAVTATMASQGVAVGATSTPATSAGSLAVSPNPLAFGSVAVGDSQAKQYTLKNSGSTSVTIAKSTPPASASFQATTALAAGTVIPAGKSVTETVVFSPQTLGSATGSWQIQASGGATLTEGFTGTGTRPPPLRTPTDTSWRLSGTAQRVTGGVQLTPASTFTAGSVAAPRSVPTDGLHASFTANLSGGTGADGVTLTLAEPTTQKFLGLRGGGLGYGGIAGVAVALDTHHNSGEPSNNFVGIADGATAKRTPKYIATSSNVPLLANHGPVKVNVDISGQTITEVIDGKPALQATVADLPPRAELIFTGSTGLHDDIQVVSHVGFKWKTTLKANPSPVIFPAAPIGSTSTKGVTITDAGRSPVVLTGKDTATQGFGLKGLPTAPTVFQPAQSLPATASHNTTATAATGSGTVGNDDGKLSIPMSAAAGIKVPNVTLALGSGSSATEQAGSTAALDVTATENGKPLTNTPVTVKVTGANPGTLPATTDSSGKATVTYTGTAAGTDSIVASVTAGGATGTSNTVSIKWSAPVASAATTQVSGDFFSEPAGSTTFKAKPGDTPAFSQKFPDVAFNPPEGLLPIPPGAPTPSTVPFTDVVTDAGGAYAGTTPATGKGYQAGAKTKAGDLTTFDGVFRGNLTVAKGGYLTLGVISGDGFLLGVGGGAAPYSGVKDGAPSSGTSPFASYKLMAAENKCLSAASDTNPNGAFQPGDYPVTIKLPAAGDYPYEIDYFSCNTQAPDEYNGGQVGPVRSLVLRAENLSTTAPSQPTLYVGYADSGRLANNLFHSFPYPWAGTPGVNFQGCAPANSCNYDSGAIRVDDTTAQSITLNKLKVTFATKTGPFAPYSCVYDIWAPDAPSGVPQHGEGPVTLKPGQSVIYTGETNGGGNCENTDGTFDTSDVPETGSCTQSEITPQVALTINGVTSTYDDKGQILNTGGVDKAYCAPSYAVNESSPWTRVAGPGTGADVPLPPAAGLTLQPTQAPGGGPLTAQVGNVQNFTATASEANGTDLSGLPVTFRVQGVNGPRQVTATTNDKGVATFSYVGRAGGSDAVAATASYQGLELGSGIANLTWQIPIPGGASSGGTPGEAPSEVTITSPTDGSTLQQSTPVQATFNPPSGESISQWKVALTGPAAQASTLASGTGAPPSTLATLDPSHLISGAYQLSVSATASGGGINTATTSFQVARVARVGQFSETYQDFTAQLAGIPITAGRTYQSFDKTVGDFGVGWHLSLSNVSVATNGPLGAGGWGIRPTNCSLFGCEYDYQSNVTHTATVTLPGGTQEVFDFSPTGGFGPLFFLGGAGGFTPRPGTNTTGTLAPFNDPGVYYGFDGNLYTSASNGVDVYSLDDFLYTDAHGTQYLISATYGLLAELQANGACLAFSPTGVNSFSGATGVFDNGSGQGTCTDTTNLRGDSSLTIARDSQNRVTSITDPNGNVYNYTYDSAGDLTNVALPNSTGTDAYTYDPNHNLLTQSGPGAPVLTQHYDAHGNLISVTDGDGHSFAVSNNSGGRTQTLTDPLGKRTTVLSYDQAGDLTTKQEESGGATRTTTYTYDGLGDLTSLTDPLGNTTKYTFDANGNRTSITDPLGNTTKYVNDALGNLTSRTDPLGHTTTATYDANSELLSVTQPSGASIKLSYDGEGNPVNITDPSGNTYKLAYNGNAGQPTSITDPLGNAASYIYDSAGNITFSQNADNSSTYYFYDAANRITTVNEPAGGMELVAYDAQGNVASTTNPNGNATTYTYDAASRLTTITDANGGSVKLAYDADGNLISVTDPDGHVITYTYDGFGDRTSARDPAGNTTSYTYDADGHVTSVTDAKGQTASYTYDADGQLTKRVTPDGTTSWGYDGAGQLASMTDPTGSTTYNYNADGLTTEVAAPQGTVAYAYDPNGERTSMTTPGGKTVSYNYDAAGNLIAESGLGQTLHLSYDPTGLLSGITRSNGVTSSYTYDADQNVASVASTSGSNTLQSWSYQRDLDGNPTSVTDANSNTTNYSYDKLDRLVSASGSSSYSYGYDPAGNITSATKNATTTAYAYNTAGQLTKVGANPVSTDANGNITGIGTKTFGWNALNELTSTTQGGTTTNYTYNGNGLRVGTSGAGFNSTDLWDQVNPSTGALTTPIPSPATGANPAPPRVPSPFATAVDQGGSQQGVGPTTANNAGSPVLPQLVSDGTNTYFTGNGQALGQISGTGAATWYLPDGLGSTTGTTGSNGTLAGSTAYSPYGQVSSQSGAQATLGFTGQLQDPGGLLYLRARYLDPGIGRFLSSDSLQPNAAGTVGYNPYAYADDSPTSATDPSGHFAGIVVFVAVATVLLIIACSNGWIHCHPGQQQDAGALADNFQPAGKKGGSIFSVTSSPLSNKNKTGWLDQLNKLASGQK